MTHPSAAPHRPSPLHGFTLIELLIAVAIIGILAAVALPNYTQYVNRSRRIEAQSLLQQNALYMQRFYSANNSFSADLSGKAPVLPDTQSPAQGTALYTVRLNPATLSATAFTLEAVPVADAAMATDECGTLSLTNVGARGANNSTVPTFIQKCWK